MSLGNAGKRDGKNTLSYQERVLAESDALYKDIAKLGMFIRSDNFKELPEIDKRLLVAQKCAMDSYMAVLETRILLFDL